MSVQNSSPSPQNLGSFHSHLSQLDAGTLFRRWELCHYHEIGRYLLKNFWMFDLLSTSHAFSKGTIAHGLRSPIRTSRLSSSVRIGG